MDHLHKFTFINFSKLLMNLYAENLLLAYDVDHMNRVIKELNERPIIFGDVKLQLLIG